MINGGQLPTSQLHDINRSALNYASRAPQLVSCSYYVCVCACIRACFCECVCACNYYRSQYVVCVKTEILSQVLKYMKTKSAEAERERQRELEREKGSFLLLWIRHNYYCTILLELQRQEEEEKRQKAEEAKKQKAELKQRRKEEYARLRAEREAQAEKEREEKQTKQGLSPVTVYLVALDRL